MEDTNLFVNSYCTKVLLTVELIKYMGAGGRLNHRIITLITIFVFR